ncbi:MAG: stalk domain-containing protein [Candidatus Cryosericum sp.]
MRKATALVLVFVLLVSAATVVAYTSTFAQSGSIVIVLQIGSKSMTVDGKATILDVPPVILEGRTLLPIRAVIEALGGTVAWDVANQKVTLTLRHTTVILWIGQQAARVNGELRPIDPGNSLVVPRIINSRTMLPIRFVAESLGCEVKWNALLRTVTIVYTQSSEASTVADLQVASVAWTPSPVREGTAVSFSARVRNNGKARSGTFSVEVWLNDQRTATGSVLGLEVGTDVTVALLPAWTATDGCSSVTAIVDPENRVLEEREDDNAFVASDLLCPTSSAGFDYSQELLGATRTLWAHVLRIAASTGSVTIGGADTRQPSIPFTFSWGDETTTEGWFDESHVYADRSRDYFVRVTAHYSVSESDSVGVLVRFAPITAQPYPAALAVTVPNHEVTLTTRQPGYGRFDILSFFDDSFFSSTQPRATVEYVLSQAARAMDKALESDHELIDGVFQQAVLRDPEAGGAYSIWYSSPVTLASGDRFFSNSIGYSSVFHEMGHNFTLNAPASFRYGGKIDGNANAVFSETVAQWFQHAIAFELLNNPSTYGITDDLARAVALDAHETMRVVKNSYGAYLAAGKPFSTWNNPGTAVDETFGTFMTLAYRFFLHAEAIQDYVQPLARAMKLLGTFDSAMLSQYSPGANIQAGTTFRSTLMIAAISYGFGEDLRSEFRQLGFPIDDRTFSMLYASLP